MIYRIEESGNTLRVYNQMNGNPCYILHSHRLMGYSDQFFIATQNGQVIYTYDEKGRRLGTMHLHDNAKLVGCAGNTFTLRSTQSIWTYDSSCRQIGSRHV